MNQSERRMILIRMLLKEHPEYQGLRIPADADSQRQLLIKGRALQHFLGNPAKICRHVNTPVHFLIIKTHIFRAESNILIAGFLKELILRVLENKANAETHLSDILIILPNILTL